MISKEELIKSIEKMSVIELNEFIELLKERFGIPTVPAGNLNLNSKLPNESQAVRNDFKVILLKPGANKIEVIKIIRGSTNLGLKEAKGIADNVPSTIKGDLTQLQAEELVQKFRAAGAEVEFK